MRWKGRERSSNVEDRRRGGGAGRVGKVGGGLGIIGVIIVVAVTLLTNDDPGAALDTIQDQMQNQTTNTQSAPTRTPSKAEDELAEFVSVVLKDCENVWNKLFPKEYGKNYREPVLVLFVDEVKSACGFASSATGPFYCPADEKLYIDLSFYDDLKTKFGAPGDFAMAYVVAHEVGHHVQNLLGTSRKVQSQRNRLSKAEYNQLSVRQELQADFFAGVWAHHADEMDDILEKGDLEEALRAANAIGDDRLQRQARGYVVPESFTHGTSAQRKRWFKKGFDTGDVRQGDTFAAKSL